VDGSAVALAAIAFATSMGAGVIWVVKYLAKELSKDLREHTAAAIEMANAGREQTEASNEVLTFMKNLNGKLAGATIQTIKEQHINTQVVNDTHVVGDRRKDDTEDRRKAK